MAKNDDYFLIELKELKAFLAKKKQLRILASRADVSPQTVVDTFNVTSSALIIGKKIEVYKEAKRLKAEIEDLLTPESND